MPACVPPRGSVVGRASSPAPTKKPLLSTKTREVFCFLLINITIYATITSKEGVNMHHDDWIAPFLAMDLCDGALVPIVNDDEDMLEIRWDDGMWIDVGFIRDEETYYITTVADDTLESWNNPLSVLKTQNRTELIEIIQHEIFRCRL